jgi:hypothetical protein
MDASSPVAYQLRIHLRGVSPPVWRRVVVPADATIADMHATIQAAMGWEDIDLHQFTIRGQWYGVPRHGAICFHAGTEDLQLSAFTLRAHERFTYEYDFHAGWLHDVRVEEILEAPVGKDLPICIGGMGRCPPEDCGSPEQFMEELDEHSPYDLLEWIEEELHSDEFCRERVREVLADWMPWVDRAFDRKRANQRLKALTCNCGEP